MQRAVFALFAVLSCAIVSCDSPTGAVQVVVVPEETIPEGLDPGTGEENIVDGWTVRYDKFVVAVGGFHAARSKQPNGATLSAPEIHVIDFTKAPEGGVVLAELKNVAAERWDRVGYDLPIATADASRASFTAQADYDHMVADGLSLIIAGRIFDAETACAEATRDVAHCKTFHWELAVPTAFNDCANPDGDAGFAVPSGGTQGVKPTIHGDHWFFTNITQGAELTERRAQWVVDGDIDADGETTLDELKARPAAQAFPTALGYNLSGGFRGPITSAYDFLIEQASTLGDYNGDGECPSREAL